MPKILTPAEFGGLFTAFKSSAFRLETLHQYKVPEETAEFQRFLDGEPLSQDKNSEWCELVSAAVKSGRRMTRVRVMPVPLTPYLRFEMEWGYTYSAAAGEEIFLLDRPFTDTLGLSDTPDFWLFDDEIAVRMLYDQDGCFKGGEREDDTGKAVFKTIRDAMLKRAMPFKEYLKKVRTT